MRIAMIGCKGIPAAASQGGGVETYVENLAVRLKDRGHQVSVYVRPYANPAKKSSYDGVELLTMPSIHTKHLDTISHTLFSSLDVLGKDVDIVHYHGVGPGTLAWIPRVFHPNAKTIVTFHSRDRFHEKWGVVARAYLAFGEWASLVFPNQTTTPSKSIQLFCEKMYGKEIVYCPNAVEIPETPPAFDLLAQFGLTPGSFFFTLTRLVAHKAIDEAIEAFRKVDTTKKLVIIGESSPDTRWYEEKLRDLAGSDTRIRFVGHQSGEVLQQLLAHGYALVHPSRSEGLSLALLESMAHAKTVIMSDIPENMELQGEGNILFPVGRVDELTRALQWAVDHPAEMQWRGLQSQNLIRSRYSWDAVVTQMESVYQSVRV